MDPELHTVYRCEKVTVDERKYGLRTAHMSRDDGIGGWFTITGTLVEGIEEGKRYNVSFVETSK